MFWHRLTAVLIAAGSAALILGTTLALLAQDEATPAPAPYLELPAAGDWQGAAYFGPAESQLAAPVSFTVTADGQLSGVIRFAFEFEGMSEELRALMAEHGCTVSFDAIAPGGEPVGGYFMAATRALGSFTTPACFLEGYGDLTFGAAITGVWYAEQVAAGAAIVAVEPTGAPATAPATAGGEAEGGEAVVSYTTEGVPAAIEVFLDNCSECHGYFGEGGPGVSDLTAASVQRMTDDAIMDVINNGVEGTEMEPWGRLLTDEEKAGVLLVIRNPHVLREAWEASQ